MNHWGYGTYVYIYGRLVINRQSRTFGSRFPPATNLALARIPTGRCLISVLSFITLMLVINLGHIASD